MKYLQKVSPKYRDVMLQLTVSEQWSASRADPRHKGKDFASSGVTKE
jgi:hypothetical protein